MRTTSILDQLNIYEKELEAELGRVRKSINALSPVKEVKKEFKREDIDHAKETIIQMLDGGKEFYLAQLMTSLRPLYAVAAKELWKEGVMYKTGKKVGKFITYMGNPK